MSPFSLLFSIRGRIDRSHWWLGQFALFGAAMFVMTAWCIIFANSMEWAGLHGQGLTPVNRFPVLGMFTLCSIFFVVAAVTIIWIGFALTVKRLHDRNATGWWVLLYAVPGVLGAVVSSSVLAVASIFYIVALGFLKGTPSDNRFNKDSRMDAALSGSAEGHRLLGSEVIT